MYEILILYKFTFAFIFLSVILLGLGLSLNFFYMSGDFEKNSAYECGFNSFLSNSNFKNFDIDFLIIAVFFLIFDLELIFLLPWVLNCIEIDLLNSCTVLFFLILLLIGFLVEYFRGVLHSNLAIFKI
jgi:NADH-quinone oxidoreductase subunit A